MLQSVFPTPANSKRFLITETRLTELEITGVWAAVPQGEDSKRKETNSTQEAWIVPDASYCLKV